MALSNSERVGRVIDILRQGLIPFILREYKQTYRAEFIAEIDKTLATNAYANLPREAYDDKQVLLQALEDGLAYLNLMGRRWSEVFQGKLGPVARSHVRELIVARHNWAHEGKFSNDEAYRVADTAARLLKMVGAAAEAQKVEEISRDLLRLRFEREAKGELARARDGKAVSALTTSAGLKPWCFGGAATS